jgi:hypothetical protein
LPFVPGDAGGAARSQGAGIFLPLRDDAKEAGVVMALGFRLHIAARGGNLTVLFEQGILTLFAEEVRA